MSYLLQIFNVLQPHTRKEHEAGARFPYSTQRLAIEGFDRSLRELELLAQTTSDEDISKVADAANAFMSYFRGNVKALRAGTLSVDAVRRGEALQRELEVQLLSARPLAAGESAPWLQDLYALSTGFDLGHYAQFLSTYLARLKGRMVRPMKGAYCRWALKFYPVVTIENNGVVILLETPKGTETVQTFMTCPVDDPLPQSLGLSHAWSSAVIRRLRTTLDALSTSIVRDVHVEAEQSYKAEVRDVHILVDRLCAGLTPNDKALLLKHGNLFSTRMALGLQATKPER